MHWARHVGWVSACSPLRHFWPGIKLAAACRASGLTLHGTALDLPSPQLPPGLCDGAFTTDPVEALRDAAVIIVAVKRQHTDAIAALLAEHAAVDACVVCLQNGMGAALQLRRALDELCGAVPVLRARGDLLIKHMAILDCMVAVNIVGPCLLQLLH